MFRPSLRKTLVITYSLIALIPMVTVSALFYRSASTDIQQQAFDQLTSVNSIKKRAIQDYFQQIRDQVTTQSSSLMMQAALSDLSEGFAAAEQQLQSAGTDTTAFSQDIESYYRDVFVPEFESQNDKAFSNLRLLTDGLDNSAIALQHEYIVSNSNGLGSKHTLDAAGNGTDYDNAHAIYHPWLKAFLDKFGYYDIFLIDREGRIVYTVYKELDFATSLVTGPYKNSNLAAVFDRAVNASTPDAVVFEDFQQYLPSYNAPASFIASPIVNDGEVAGVLVFQMPIDRINALMGQREGMGESGESYLVGPDNLMRSDSYLDPENHSVINSIRFPEHGSIQTEATQLALAGESGTRIIEDYNGNPVLSSFAPLYVFGSDWSIVSEIDETEALAAVNELRSMAMLLTTAVAIAVAVLAFLLANSMARPMIRIANAVRKIAEGSLDVDIQVRRKDEIGQLGEAMQQMQKKLKLLIDDSIRPIVAKASVGQLEDRLHMDNASGFYNDLIVSMNSLLDVNETFLNDTAKVVGAMSEGNLSERSESRFQGRFAQVQQDIESMRKTLETIITIDVQGIVSAASAGDLSTRIDMDGKQGCFDELARGINALVDINDNIIHDVSAVTSALSEGRLDTSIERRYQGQFGELVDNVTTMQQRLQAVIEQDIQRIVQAAVEGDLSKRIDLAGKEGFYHSLSSSVNNLVGTCDEIISESSEVMAAMADGDLTKQITKSYNGTFDQLKNDINRTIVKLTDIVKQIQHSASAVKTGASEISKGSIDLSSRTEEQAASLEETSASMEELTATVRETAANSEMATKLALESNSVASKGGDVVNDAVTAMEAILKSSETIANFVNVIDEIAFQTNLLALNASVEAARAGEQGKGFAVVAEEVRVLASRSANSAKEIKQQVEDSRLRVNEGSDLVNESGRVLSEIIVSIDKVNQIVREISIACDEQSKGLDEINGAVTQMDDATQQNAALVEESAAASESLSNQAEQLDQLVSYFRVSNTGGKQGSTGKPQLRLAN